MMNSFYNPDVLECLANLSNDEVFTPPDIANEMLNKLPKILFERPDTTFFDPACKSGIFLREITKRLIIGTEHLYPDRQTCVDHILKKQVFGMAITEMTSYLSRRSLYCSKYPDQQFSVTKFESPNGEIFYKRVNHEWQNGRCILCGASQEKFDRSETFENYAYPFIHGEDPEKIFNMKFDVIISNPPYHLSDGGQKASATPLYQKFVSQAKKLNPKFLMMIIPARWYSGGRGLETFRKEMLNDDRIEYLIDYTDSNDCFPGVDIAGGICYFLWNRNYHGKCKITNFYQQKHFNSIRPLNQYDSFLRYSEALAIIQKVQKNERKFYNSIVSSQKPFGLRTYVKPEATGDILLRYSGGTGKFSRDKVTNGREWIDKWKVIISYLTYDHAGRPDKDGKRKILSTMEVLPPQVVCTETYLVVDSFNTQLEADNLVSYLRTKFVRFLLAQLTSTQHLSKSNFSFVPIQDFSKSWTDEELYTKYSLTDEEIAFIESMIKPMEFEDNSDV